MPIQFSWGKQVTYSKLLILIGIVVGLSGCGKEQPAADNSSEAVSSPIAAELSRGGSAAEEATVQITDAYLRSIIVEISDDKYEGRGPSSRGDVAARKYLAEQMAELGILPGASDGGWEQLFDLLSVNTIQPATWTFDLGEQSSTFKQWDDFMLRSGVQEERVEVTDAEVVFVGYGIDAPEYDWDDFEGVDLKGKVLLIMNNDPDWDPDLFAGETRLWYGRWDYKYEKAAELGAVGAILIHTQPSAGYPFQVLQTSGTGPQFELPKSEGPQSQFNSHITEDMAYKLVALAGYDLDALREAAFNRDFAPVPLGITTSVSMNVEIDRVQSANVLGLIPGSDPELADEVVIYTAHHDHLGIGTPDADGDAIYNGAMDNASGVAMVMSMAKAFKALPTAPRRSILIALVGAEEQGLLGSQWFAQNPTFAPGKIAANINYDGGNIWGHTHDVTYIGFGKTSIDEILTLIAGEQGRVVKPDQFPDRGYFYRSDQFSFAKVGVPAVYIEPGMDFVDRPSGWGREQVDHFTDVDYHQPSDEYDPGWNLEGMVRDATTGYWTGLAIANADEMPTWVPGDEFEATRLEALAAEKD